MIEFGPQEKNFSMARAFPGSSFDPSSEFTPTDRITPGFPNTEAGYALFDKSENGSMGVHDIMFNEVLVNGYHIIYQYSKSTKSDRPFDADYGAWIEIYNKADYPIVRLLMNFCMNNYLFFNYSELMPGSVFH